jgi:hypothetical protein
LDNEKDICSTEVTCKRLWNISNLSPYSMHWPVLLKKHFPDISPIYALPSGIQFKYVAVAIQTEIKEAQAKTSADFQRAFTAKLLEINNASEEEKERRRIEVFGTSFDGTIDSIDQNSMLGRVKSSLPSNDKAIKAGYNRQFKFNNACENVAASKGTTL